MKMYILIKDSVPLGLAITAAAHASLGGYLKFEKAPEVALWLGGPFKKVICKVSAAEFESAKKYEDNLVMTESAMDGQETAIVFKPREEWPPEFRTYKLYK